MIHDAKPKLARGIFKNPNSNDQPSKIKTKLKIIDQLKFLLVTMTKNSLVLRITTFDPHLVSIKKSSKGELNCELGLDPLPFYTLYHNEEKPLIYVIWCLWILGWDVGCMRGFSVRSIKLIFYFLFFSNDSIEVEGQGQGVSHKSQFEFWRMAYKYKIQDHYSYKVYKSTMQSCAQWNKLL